MQSHYPAQFVRDMGCTEAEWRKWLPQALGTRTWHYAACTPNAPSGLTAEVDAGHLHLTWQPLEPRRLGLAVLPRLQVCFDFDAHISSEQRHTFMRRFDLYTQRGGG